MFVDALFGHKRGGLPAPFTGLSGNALSNLLFGMQDVPLPTKTGEVINAESALGSSVVFRCINLIAEKYAQVPIMLKQTMPTGGTKTITDHWAARALGISPNPEMDLVTFKKLIIAWRYMRGQMFCEKDVSNDESTGYLWPLTSPTMLILRDWGSPGNKVVYKYSYNVYQEHAPAPKVYTRNFDASQLLAMLDFTLNGIVGVSRIAIARESIALGLSYEAFASRFVANDAVPRGFIVTKSNLKKETKQAMREEWERALSGENRYKVGILDGELDFKAAGMASKDAEFLDSRTFQIQEVARWFGVPSHLVGDLSRSTNNNIEQQSLEFLTNCMDPLFRAQESSFNRCLLTDDELDAGYHFEHDRNALLAADLVATADSSQKDILSGVKTLNEVRDARGLNPVKNGDLTFFNLAYGPVGNGYMTTNEIRKKAGLPPVEGGDVIMGLKSQQPETPDSADPQDKNNPMGGAATPPAGPNAPEKNAPQQQAPGAKQKPGSNKSAVKRALLPIFTDAFQRVINKEALKLENLLKRNSYDISQAVAEIANEMDGYVRSALRPAVISFAELLDDSQIRAELDEILARIGREYALTSIAELGARDTDGGIRLLLTDWRGNRAKRTAEEELNTLMGDDQP